MASRQQQGKQAAHAVPTFRSLIEETDDLIRRQRQKGAEYKFREGPGRPAVSLEVDSGLSAPSAPSGTSSPAKTKSEGGNDGPSKAAAGAADPRSVNLDTYDPHEQAMKEQKALVETVSKMRGEASHLYAEVGALSRRYDTLRAALEQLAYEDDVDSERRIGLNKMRDLKGRIQFLTLSLEDAEHYSRVLNQMVKRLSDEKLSQLATMKAFEDALRAQRHELELVQDVQRGVVKSRDEEVTELVRLQGEVKKQLASLDRKLEARRMEVKTRQEKAKWRLAKLQEELSLKAQAEGDLTEEEERAMIEKAKNLSQEAAELRAEKIRAQADADSAEAEYAKIRFAAGVAASGDGQEPQIVTGDGAEEEEGGSFVAPDPHPIIERFNTLEDEMRNIEDQLTDYTARVSVLQQQLALLKGLAEPRAKDERDEDDRDVAILQALKDRISVAKRSLEGSQREAEEARSVRMQLEQSVSVLMERLDIIPPPFLGTSCLSPEQAEAEALAAAELDEVEQLQPTPWSKSVHDRTVSAARALHALIRVMDPVAAAAALAKAQVALAKARSGTLEIIPAPALREGHARREGDADNSSAGVVAGGQATVKSSNADNEMSAGDVEVDRRMDATIESLIVKNEWSIRVRPGSSGLNRPGKAISGRALAEAVQAFEKTWKDASSGATANPTSFTSADFLPSDRTGDAFSKEASRQRRRNSRIELETAFASAAVAATGGSVPIVTEDGGDDEGGQTRGKKKSDGKPKTKDITRFLATAAVMSGDDVDEAMLPVGASGNRKEAEDVLTRDRLKRNVKVATAAQQQAGSAVQKPASQKR